jgi:predicted ATP-grasp superfamily ATP-dependent carboligase
MYCGKGKTRTFKVGQALNYRSPTADSLLLRLVICNISTAICTMQVHYSPSSSSRYPSETPIHSIADGSRQKSRAVDMQLKSAEAVQQRLSQSSSAASRHLSFIL